MNTQIRNLIERPYQDVVDDILTAIVGGVVNEPILFDVKSDLYRLAETACEIRGITGTHGEKHHIFLKEVDFLFDEGHNAVAWQEGGDRPDDDTTFYVDYFRPETENRSPLSDINVGSVTRTLSEAIGREISTVYKQIEFAYLAGFIDEAEGKSLDFVVSILGVERKESELAEGLVTFFREAEVTGVINIPQGTRLTTAKDEVVFETSQPRTLQRGQARIDVPVRAGQDFAGEAGLVEAGTITEMVQPPAGISRVTNLEATAKAAADENDEELRLRAKARLRALGKATLAALDRVLREGRGKPVEFWDPASPPAKRSDPGTVTVLVDAEPERFPSLRAVVEETRAAGVVATLVARYVFMKPRLAVEIAAGLNAAGKEAIKDKLIAALRSYVDGLGSGKPAEGAKMLEALQEVDDAKKPRFLDVAAWRSDVSGPGSEALLDALAGAAAETPAGDASGLRDALSKVLQETGSLAPTGRRIPDRGLVQSAAEESTSARAGDEEIEKAEFRVVAEVAGESWWVDLDMEPADIVLEEKKEA